MSPKRPAWGWGRWLQLTAEFFQKESAGPEEEEREKEEEKETEARPAGQSWTLSTGVQTESRGLEALWVGWDGMDNLWSHMASTQGGL